MCPATKKTDKPENKNGELDEYETKGFINETSKGVFSISKITGYDKEDKPINELVGFVREADMLLLSHGYQKFAVIRNKKE